MKRNTTLLACVLTLTSLFNYSNAQVAGDYQTKVPLADVDWFNPANWQIYDGTTWQNAVAYPTATDGVITILGSDSIVITGATPLTIDQVVVSTSAVLVLFGGTYTLNDGAGTDLTVNGRVYVGSAGFFPGAGSIQVNSTGWLVVRSGGRLQVASTINDGYGETGGNGFIETGTYTNNGLYNFIGAASNSIALNNNAVFNNNGTFQILGAGNRFLTSGVAGGGTFNNSTTGIINNSAGLNFTISNINFNHAGDLRGTGINNYTATGTVTGNVSPGGVATAGVFRINQPFISAEAVKINIELFAAPGAGNDQLEVTGAGNVDLSAATLNVIDNASAPVGTYTILSIVAPSASNFVPPIGTINIPGNYGNLTINAKSITVDKLVVVPLTWGSFTARQNNGRVALNWTTLQELNVSHFVVEHSTDGKKYNAIGNVTAVGNSNEKNSYAFEHSTPQHSGRNFYRVLEIDLDGKSAYSVVRTVKLGDNSAAAIAIRSNPVENGTLLVESELTNASAFITGINGTVIKEIRLHQGINNISVAHLAAGVYTMNVLDNKKRVFSGRFIKK